MIPLRCTLTHSTIRPTKSKPQPQISKMIPSIPALLLVALSACKHTILTCQTPPLTPPGSATQAAALTGSAKVARQADICDEAGNIFPVPGDCTKYIKCDQGGPTVYTCPDGTSFDVNNEKCAAGINASCDLSRRNVARQADFACPSPFGAFPNPADCSKYYECVNGMALGFNCPAGLVFSPNLGTCAADFDGDTCAT